MQTTCALHSLSPFLWYWCRITIKKIPFFFLDKKIVSCVLVDVQKCIFFFFCKKRDAIFFAFYAFFVWLYATLKKNISDGIVIQIHYHFLTLFEKRIIVIQLRIYYEKIFVKREKENLKIKPINNFSIRLHNNMNKYGITLSRFRHNAESFPKNMTNLQRLFGSELCSLVWRNFKMLVKKWTMCSLN